jgi:DNA-binding transcriptional MerR regulator
MITLQQVLDRSKKAGVPITKRTFEYYRSLGLLPRPSNKRVGERGRGVYGYYHPKILQMIKKIHKYKEAGFSLKDIKDISEKYVLDTCNEILRDWGLSGKWDRGGIMSELLGSKTMSKTQRQMINKYVTEKGFKYYTSRYTKKEIAEENREAKKAFEVKISSRVEWWHPKEEIEYEVVYYIHTDAKSALYGIQLVLEKMRGSKELKKVLDTYIETLKIYDKSLSRMYELGDKIREIDMLEYRQRK